jgi:hypothetical protein
MLRTADIDMASSVTPNEVDVFLDNRAWAIHSTFHTLLKASPGTAIFGCNMLFDIPFLGDWNEIGENRQLQTDLNMCIASTFECFEGYTHHEHPQKLYQLAWGVAAHQFEGWHGAQGFMWGANGPFLLAAAVVVAVVMPIVCYCSVAIAQTTSIRWKPSILSISGKL